MADAKDVAVGKSLVAARGPLWYQSDRKRKRILKGLRGVDRDSDWGCSKHDGWVQGYSFEVVVTATKASPVFPLLASADRASAKATRTFVEKIGALPESTQHVTADSGYDSNALGEQVEWTEQGRRTGRRFLHPENKRGTKQPPEKNIQPRDESHRRRLVRRKFYQSPSGKPIYQRRRQTVEPFNEWFKSLFEWTDRVWHRGLQNNQPQLLAAIFAYQLLVRYNHRRGKKNGQVRWILDMMRIAGHPQVSSSYPLRRIVSVVPRGAPP
ncbi:MAG: hypothetical protein KatS3mg111_0111 [Pirellulaceae bacterium]|nr:MAG: hypothetical protein KatS3mg111_0111 [Pirellulaceae bacterium]